MLECWNAGIRRQEDKEVRMLGYTILRPTRILPAGPFPALSKFAMVLGSIHPPENKSVLCLATWDDGHFLAISEKSIFCFSMFNILFLT